MFGVATLALCCVTSACGSRSQLDEEAPASGFGSARGILAGIEAGSSAPRCESECLNSIIYAPAGCKLCHSPTLKSSGLDLESSGLTERLKDIRAKHDDRRSPILESDCARNDKLIDTLDIEASWLLKKIRGQQGNCGTPMPQVGSLTDLEKACMAEYVTCVAGR